MQGADEDPVGTMYALDRYSNFLQIILYVEVFSGGQRVEAQHVLTYVFRLRENHQ